MDVEWEKENILPLEYWLDDEQKVQTKSGSSGRIHCNFEITEPLGEVNLYVPKAHMVHITKIFLDNHELQITGAGFVFDDEYDVMRLNEAQSIGKHRIMIEKTAPLTDEYFMMIKGEFDVDIKSSNPFFKRNYGQYNLMRWLPEKINISLSKRRGKLRTDRSWAEQGHPFYSGNTVYRTALSLPQSNMEAKLVFPNVQQWCSVKVNGLEIGTKVFRPYEFSLTGFGQALALEITVGNTYANMMEFYKAPSGLIERGYIAECRH